MQIRFKIKLMVLPLLAIFLITLFALHFLGKTQQANAAQKQTAQTTFHLLVNQLSINLALLSAAPSPEGKTNQEALEAQETLKQLTEALKGQQGLLDYLKKVDQSLFELIPSSPLASEKIKSALTSIKKLSEIYDEGAAAYFQQLTSCQNFYFILGIVFLLAIGAMTFLLSGFFTKRSIIQIDEILTVTENLSAKKISPALTAVHHNEWGSLAININKSMESLNAFIADVKNTSIENREINRLLSDRIENSLFAVSHIAKNINTMNEQFVSVSDVIRTSKTAFEKIFSTITGLTEQIENQSSAVSETSASIEEISASIGNVARITRDRQKSTAQLNSIIKQGGQKVEATNQIISDISKNVDSMKEMIEIINNVASQTNLLSMNASIEAAHAGEYGKGFAVVADEIRKLSDSTKQNAKSISSVLNEIINMVTTGLKSSTESGDAFRKINSQMLEVVTSFEEITQTTDELLNASKEILHASGSLLKITEEIKQGSTDIKLGTENLNTSMAQIQSVSESYLENIADIKSCAEAITGGVAEIASLAIDNNRNIESLNQIIGEYKIVGTSDEEDISTGLDFATVRLIHLDWFITIKNFISDKIELTEKDIVSHQDCELGKWLARGKESFLAHYKDTEIIYIMHKRIHHIIEKIITLKINGQNEPAEELFEDLEEISVNFLTLIKRLEHKVESLSEKKSHDSITSFMKNQVQAPS